MTKAYYLRNEQEDTEGRIAKWNFLPNWRELMDAGKSTKRGYVAGDKLVLVNREGEGFNQIEEFEVFHSNLTDLQIAEAMFCLFNRKDFGDEREFDGPSMSEGDLVALVRGSEITLLQVAEVGFVLAELTPETKQLVSCA